MVLRESAILNMKQLSQLYYITTLLDWMKLGSLFKNDLLRISDDENMALFSCFLPKYRN